MKYKRFKVVVSLLLALMMVFALVACQEDNKKDEEIYAIYNLYVAEAKAANQNPLSYAAWLVTIKGEDGRDGAEGKSAYEVWLKNGHSGTEKDFLDWLKGATGDKGEAGKSAYEIWL